MARAIGLCAISLGDELVVQAHIQGYGQRSTPKDQGVWHLRTTVGTIRRSVLASDRSITMDASTSEQIFSEVLCNTLTKKPLAVYPLPLGEKKWLA
jgi:hypothetical protein